MTITLNGTTGIVNTGSETITGALTAANFTAASTFGFKNRIINGAMVIDQRNAGASTTPTANFTYTLDRWVAGLIQSSKFSVQQNAGSVTPPAGFTNYLGITSLSAYSITSTDYFNINQFIEGFNWADLGFGTANAKTVTLSFWVYSSLTGTFGGCLQNSAGSRSYPFTYTISSASTWEQKTVTISGDTSGTWVGATNGIGARLWISLGTGSSFTTTAGAWATGNYIAPTGATSVVGTSSATFYITGVQLETGSVATTFDYRPYGTELALCQRYYLLLARGSGYELGIGTVWGASDVRTIIPTPVTLRSTPTVSASNNANDFSYYCGGNVRYSSTVTFDTYGLNVMEVASSTLSSTLTPGYSAMVRAQNSTSFLAFSAEL